MESNKDCALYCAVITKAIVLCFDPCFSKLQLRLITDNTSY